MVSRIVKLVPIFVVIGALLVALPVLAQGGPVNYGDNVIGSLSAEAPFAIYSFNGTAGDLVTAQVVAIAPDLAPSVSLLSPSQVQLAVNDGDPFGVGDGSDARLSYRLPDTGLYSLLIASTNGTAGDFLLRLRGEPAPESMPALSDAPAVAALQEGTPSQVYVVNADPAGFTQVVVATATPNFSYLVTARNANGQIIAMLVGAQGQDVTLLLPPGQDVYEVEVMGMVSGVPGIVTLTSGPVGQPSSAPSVPPTAAAPSVATVTPQTPPDPLATEEVAPPAAGPPEGVCSVGSPGGNVNLRSGPGTDFAIVGTLFPGNFLMVTGVTSDLMWYTVDFAGQTAWVYGQVVMFYGPCNTLPVVQAPSSSAATAPSSSQASPTATYTTTATSTLQTGVTATSTPSYTPTTQTANATATYTPSYTPTTPPAAQIAPPDARFNNPLNIPLDNTASVLDFVSYPDGDTEDRVRWDIIGMNQNSSLSGGRARLVLSVSCFGEGTENIQFFTGGQTYVCGQTIVDREVTYDSRTGSVVITAVGGQGTYVQWVLTGTATRTN